MAIASDELVLQFTFSRELSDESPDIMQREDGVPDPNGVPDGYSVTGANGEPETEDDLDEKDTDEDEEKDEEDDIPTE